MVKRRKQTLTVDQLIEQLKEAKEKHNGDLEIMMYTLGHGPYDVATGVESAEDSETGRPLFGLYPVDR